MVSLSNPTNATISVGTATGTIIDDDGPLVDYDNDDDGLIEMEAEPRPVRSRRLQRRHRRRGLLDVNFNVATYKRDRRRQLRHGGRLRPRRAELDRGWADRVRR